MSHADSTTDVDFDIARAMHLYLTDDLGLSEDFARGRSASEMDRYGAKVVIAEFARRGISFEDKAVLDLGAGLGAMSEELVLQGANTFAIEPGSSWASLAKRRAERHNAPYTLMEARGEDLPFADETMDAVVSLQVLEHVQKPEEVIAEVFRVLKPGGQFYLACANYLAFREEHYRVFWLPLLPKSIGSLYLRARGRSPQFLKESVTYVTFPQVMKWTRRTGFVCYRDATPLDRFTRQGGFVGSTLRVATKLTRGRLPLVADRVFRTFRAGIWETFTKPS